MPKLMVYISMHGEWEMVNSEWSRAFTSYALFLLFPFTIYDSPFPETGGF